MQDKLLTLNQYVEDERARKRTKILIAEMCQYHDQMYTSIFNS